MQITKQQLGTSHRIWIRTLRTIPKPEVPDPFFRNHWLRALRLPSPTLSQHPSSSSVVYSGTLRTPKVVEGFQQPLPGRVVTKPGDYTHIHPFFMDLKGFH